MRLITVGIEQLEGAGARGAGSPSAQLIGAARRGQDLPVPIVAPLGGRRHRIVTRADVWAAVQMVGGHDLQVLVAERALSDVDAADPITVAEAYRDELAVMVPGPGQARVRQRDLATRIGVSRTSVTHALRLLELPPTARNLVRRGVLGRAQAKALLAESDQRRLEALAQRASDERWSVRRINEAVREGRGGADRPSEAPKASGPEKAPTDTEMLARAVSDPDTRAFLRTLEGLYGVSVVIRTPDASVVLRCSRNAEVMCGVLERLVHGGAGEPSLGVIEVHPDIGEIVLPGDGSLATACARLDRMYALASLDRSGDSSW